MDLFNFDESFIAPATITTRLDQQAIKGPDGLLGGTVSGTELCRTKFSAKTCSRVKQVWNWIKE